MDDGIALLDEGPWEDAVTAFTEVVASEPDDTAILAWAYVDRSRAAGNLGRTQEARDDLEAVIVLLPANDELAPLGRRIPCRLGCSVMVDSGPPYRHICGEAHGVGRSVMADAHLVLDLDETLVWTTHLASSHCRPPISTHMRCSRVCSVLILKGGAAWQLIR